MYDILNVKRSKLFLEQYQDNAFNLKNALEQHRKTENFLANVFSKAIPEAKQYLLEINKGPAMSSQCSRTLVLMDATGSMSNLLHKAKNTVGVMFERANDILKSTDAFML